MLGWTMKDTMDWRRRLGCTRAQAAGAIFFDPEAFEPLEYGTRQIPPSVNELCLLLEREHSHETDGQLAQRRSTAVERLPLQSFDDDWLDGPRVSGELFNDAEKYRLAGNAWPVAVAAWILKGILDRMSMNERGANADTKPKTGITSSVAIGPMGSPTKTRRLNPAVVRDTALTPQDRPVGSLSRRGTPSPPDQLIKSGALLSKRALNQKVNA